MPTAGSSGAHISLRLDTAALMVQKESVLASMMQRCCLGWQQAAADRACDTAGAASSAATAWLRAQAADGQMRRHRPQALQVRMCRGARDRSWRLLRWVVC